MSYSATILADSPIAYWRLGESSGTTLFDETANSYDLTTANSPTLGATGLLVGDSDTAVTFDGVDQFANRELPAAFKTQSFSFEAWLSVSSTGVSGLLCAASPTGTANDGRGAAIGLSGGIPRLRLGRDDTASFYVLNGSSDVGIGTHHLVGTFDNGSIALYLDGQSINTDSVAWGVEWDDKLPGAGGLGPSPEQVYISGDRNNTAGTDANSGFFTGTIDEVAVYDYALTATQVLEHYEVGTGLQEATAPFIAANSAIYAPVAENASGPLTALVPFLASGANIYAPTASGGPVTAVAPYVDATSVLYAPVAAAGAVTVTAPYLASGSVLYAPIAANSDPWVKINEASTTWTEISDTTTSWTEIN